MRMEEEEEAPPSNFNQFLSPTHPIINHHHLSVFPPVNHEDLPIPQPPPPPPPPRCAPHAPLSADPDDHPSSSPPPPPPPPPKHKYIHHKNYTQLFKWFDFALHFWNSKLLFFLTHLPSPGSILSLRSVAAAASSVVVFWLWVRRRRSVSGGGRGGGGEMESVEHLKSIIKAKDEKILQLLEQIAEMNKVLLARYRIPVLKAS